MGADQKYHVREGHLYALMFKSGQVYIGQTVDMGRRQKQHAKAWAAPFEMIQLGTMQGTQAQGEDYEYAWRFRAAAEGYPVLAKTWDGTVFAIHPQMRMTSERQAIAKRCQWPGRSSKRKLAWFWQWMAWQGGALAGVVMGLRLPL